VQLEDSMNFAIGNRWFRFVPAAGVAATMLLAGLAGAPLLADDTEAEAPTKTIKMTVENFKWVPKQIRVAKGSKVVLQIRSYDATHRFDLKKPYDLKVVLPQGATTTVEFVASHVGTFKWKCGRPCGNGCPKMTGKLTVYDPEAPLGDEKD